MRIGIVGWGVEGQSAYSYFGPENEYLIVNEEPRDDFPPESDKIKVQFIDKNRQPGLTGNVEDLSYLDGLDKCDKVVYSPVAPKNLRKFFGDDQQFWSKASSALHIFFETVKTKNIIGVTGTKGKGTTSTLISKMLEAQGKKVFLGGNIGKSVLDFVREVHESDWVVLELSSFQLYNFPCSPHVAVSLMIVPEHMDYHSDVGEYAGAKANIFKHQKAGDIAIYFAENEESKRIAQLSAGKKIPYYEKPGAFVRHDGMIIVGESETEIMPTTEVKLLGEHNLQNICAAITAVWEVDQNAGAIKQVITTFTGLEHRLEFVRELDGVKYYDDSFATTPETAIVAVKAISEPKVLILGGHDKGADYESMADEILKSNISHVITIGLVGPRIANELKSKGFSSITESPSDMKSIVAAARQNAQPGDVVLLSTGTSSFGMFKDYKDRGNQFKQAVRVLA